MKLVCSECCYHRSIYCFSPYTQQTCFKLFQCNAMWLLLCSKWFQNIDMRLLMCLQWIQHIVMWLLVCSDYFLLHQYFLAYTQLKICFELFQRIAVWLLICFELFQHIATQLVLFGLVLEHCYAIGFNAQLCGCQCVLTIFYHTSIFRVVLVHTLFQMCFQLFQRISTWLLLCLEWFQHIPMQLLMCLKWI